MPAKGNLIEAEIVSLEFGGRISRLFREHRLTFEEQSAALDIARALLPLSDAPDASDISDPVRRVMMAELRADIAALERLPALDLASLGENPAPIIKSATGSSEYTLLKNGCVLVGAHGTALRIVVLKGDDGQVYVLSEPPSGPNV